MSGLYYNLALRNSDLRDKDSEKLYYCVLKNRSGYVCQLSEPDHRNKRGYMPGSTLEIGSGCHQLSERRAKR